MTTKLFDLSECTHQVTLTDSLYNGKNTDLCNPDSQLLERLQGLITYIDDNQL